MKTISLLVSTLAVALAPCANLRAEEQVTVTFQGSDLTMPKSVFEAAQNAGKKMVEHFIEEQEKNQNTEPISNANSHSNQGGK